MSYQAYVENLRIIDYSIQKISLDLRRSISEKDRSGEISYTKLLSYLIACWAEVRILKLISEPNGFSALDIQNILQTKNAKERWVQSLQIAFANAYSLNKNNISVDLQRLNNSSLLIDNLRFDRYDKLKKIINKDLLTSVEIRNKIAHGEWRYAFDIGSRSISLKHTRRVNRENIVILQIRKKIFETLAELIHFLNVSPPAKISNGGNNAYEKFFTKHYEKLVHLNSTLEKKSYVIYKTNMIEKYIRGLRKKRSRLNRKEDVVSSFLLSLYKRYKKLRGI